LDLVGSAAKLLIANGHDVVSGVRNDFDAAPTDILVELEFHRAAKLVMRRPSDDAALRLAFNHQTAKLYRAAEPRGDRRGARARAGKIPTRELGSRLLQSIPR
jgi:hypothetical protein